MIAKNKAIGYVLLCVFFWGLVPVVAKTGQASLDNHQFLFWSSLISFLTLFVLTACSGKLKHFSGYRVNDILYITFLGLLGTYVYYLFLYLGYSKSAGMEVLVMQYTWPLTISVLSIFILKERLSVKKMVALLLGFMGVVIVLSKGDLGAIVIENASVMLLVGVGASSFALFSVLSKKVTFEPLGVVTLYFFAATLASFISMMVFSGIDLPERGEWLSVCLNGILVNGVSYVFWLRALRLVEASYLAPFTFIAPIIAALNLIVFFDEPFLPAYVTGFIFVIAGGLLSSVSRVTPPVGPSSRDAK